MSGLCKVMSDGDRALLSGDKIFQPQPQKGETMK